MKNKNNIISSFWGVLKKNAHCWVLVRLNTFKNKRLIARFLREWRHLKKAHSDVFSCFLKNVDFMLKWKHFDLFIFPTISLKIQLFSFELLFFITLTFFLRSKNKLNCQWVTKSLTHALDHQKKNGFPFTICQLTLLT